MPPTQTTSASMASAREKGVRRPLGDINVNQASSSSGNSSNNSVGQNDGGPTVVKLPSKSSSGSQKTPVNSQKLSWSKTQSSSSFDDERSTSTSTTTTKTASLQFKSIFRQAPPKFDDCLALKPANPITEPATEERDESDSVRNDDVDVDLSPFTRDDDTRVIESFDTTKLRNIFRSVLSSHESNDEACIDDLDDSTSDDMRLLKRSSPILSEEDLRNPHDDDDDSNNCDERPTTLDWNNLLSESTPICYKI